jgi:hypothetical protein
MDTILAIKTSDGYEVFKNGDLFDSPKTLPDLISRLHYFSIIGRSQHDFLHKLEETGRAMEEMPQITIRQA